ncbi:MAG: T6SS effector amidase Tae4 family protein [Massilia sp.]
MKQHYPDASVLTPALYDEKIGGRFVKLYEQAAYQNTCAVRMSYGLNKSGIRLDRNPNAGGSVQGGDGLWYWIRVKDLKAELSRRFKGADAELSLTVIPPALYDDSAEMSRLYKARVQEAKAFLDTTLGARSGIMAFEVSGWGDASGHFTLWDGGARQLAYATGHDTPDNNMYYFWLTSLTRPDGKAHLVQVVKVRFWELK